MSSQRSKENPRGPKMKRKLKTKVEIASEFVPTTGNFTSLSNQELGS